MKTEHVSNNIPSGVSIESASYMENNNLDENDNNLNSKLSENNERNILLNYFLKIKIINQMKLLRILK